MEGKFKHQTNAKHRVGCEEVKRVKLHLDRKRVIVWFFLFGSPVMVKGCDIKLLVSLYEQCEEDAPAGICLVTNPPQTTSVLI